MQPLRRVRRLERLVPLFLLDVYSEASQASSNSCDATVAGVRDSLGHVEVRVEDGRLDPLLLGRRHSRADLALLLALGTAVARSFLLPLCSTANFVRLLVGLRAHLPSVSNRACCQRS